MPKDNFEKIIQNFTDKKPSKEYTLPSGSSILKIDEQDEEAFKSLFHFSHNKDTGNGEISIYWLFSPNSQTNHGGHNSDLLINLNSCEIKSYSHHFGKIALGNWGSDRNSRYLINSLFSFHNITANSSSFFSEGSFTLDNIKTSYESLLTVNNTHYEGLISNKSKEVMLSLTGSTSEEVSKNLVVQILINKFIKKPGNNGYVINLIPSDPTNIYIHRINLEKLTELTYDDLRYNFDVNNGKLRINYKIFNKEEFGK